MTTGRINQVAAFPRRRRGDRGGTRFSQRLTTRPPRPHTAAALSRAAGAAGAMKGWISIDNNASCRSDGQATRGHHPQTQTLASSPVRHRPPPPPAERRAGAPGRQTGAPPPAGGGATPAGAEAASTAAPPHTRWSGQRVADPAPDLAKRVQL